ncbi:hypothetical protein LRR81_07110 [Metabacillus sp. GX 13764]|nr:hypothetical protein [Metabacillus kandeliae]MCD7034002.1 hypothetical protein [Metabacillus kandeliae]
MDSESSVSASKRVKMDSKVIKADSKLVKMDSKGNSRAPELRHPAGKSFF